MREPAEKNSAGSLMSPGNGVTAAGESEIHLTTW
jgi:hypothetical protein